MLLSYVPRRVLILVVPIGVLVAVLVDSPQRKTLFLLLLAFLGGAQISSYLVCWWKHVDLDERYGDAYRARLSAELERVGFEGLLDRFWVGLRPR